MLRSYLAALFVLVALVFPTAPASADPFTPEANLAYRLAAEYWGVEAPPLCTSTNKHMESVLIDDKGASLAGWATIPTQPQPCDIAVGIGQSFDALCPVVAHEYGHLLGYGHDFTGDSAQVMVADHTQTPQCYPWVRRLALPANLERQRRWCAHLVEREAEQHRSGERANLAHCRHRVRRIRAQIERWQPFAEGALG